MTDACSCLQILRDPDGASRGFGFVSYDTPEESLAAVAGMNGKSIAGQQIYVALSHHNAEKGAYPRYPDANFQQVRTRQFHLYIL